MELSRFGQSCTRLPDDRLVRIGGEHEDHYDSDFHIYDDVIVRSPNGVIAIFGYPRAVFPPTDFHSATLVGDRIVVVGCLGHPEQRRARETPVFAFDTRTWKCTQVETTGDAPGWIHRHCAYLAENGTAIVVTGGLRDPGGGGPLPENCDDWRLDLDGARWSRLTSRAWQQWRFERRDGQSHRLNELRTAWTEFRDGDRWGFGARAMAELVAKLGTSPDLDLAARLHRPSVPHETVARVDDEHGVDRIRVAGVTLRFVQDSWCIRLVVEGALEPDVVRAVIDEFRVKLERLERCEWVATRL